MSKIEWTGKTWNPVAGCKEVSPGCANCYAVTSAYRNERMGQDKYRGLTVLQANGKRSWTGDVRCVPAALDVPLKRRTPTTYFVNSMSDLFHENVPFEFIDQVFAVMALCPQHTFQILTKRPARMAEYLESFNDESGCASESRHENFNDLARDFWLNSGREEGDELADLLCYTWPLPNVWLGTSVEDQKRADERIPHLLRCPAAVRFLSCEPLLGPVNLTALDNGNDEVFDVLRNEITTPWRDTFVTSDCKPVDWVIVGGESGPGARTCNLDWLHAIVNDCRDAGVPVFVKQLGSRWAKCCIVEFKCGCSEEISDGIHGSGCPPYCATHGDAKRYVHRNPAKHPKGGDPGEWPEDLRVREMPKAVPV